MSDGIYDEARSDAIDNFVTVAQACHGLLTKQHYANQPSKSYDRVKYFNFFEVNIWTLGELYNLSVKMLSKPKCCFIRCRVKDYNKRRHVLRRVHDRDDGEATLIPYRCNWFALDIDGFGVSCGDLLADAHQVLLALGAAFRNAECFAVASGSYGIKPAIHMRLFFWADKFASNADIGKMLRNNNAKVDLALHSNPIQPIYTAAPIFGEGLSDPVGKRIVWIHGETPIVEVRSENVNYAGQPEILYTKQEADRQAAKYYRNISRLPSGDRHTGLIQWCFPLGKLVGQGHFVREDVIDIAFNHCSFWIGKRDTKKDMATIVYTIDRGIDAIEKHANGETDND